MNDPTRHLTDGELQSWLDGALPDADAARVAGHVAGCEACAGEAARIRGLLAALRALPRGLAPPEEVRGAARRRALEGGTGEALESGIGRALEGGTGGHLERETGHNLEGQAVPLEARRNPRPRRRVGLAAAAIGLLLIGAAAGALLAPGGGPAGSGVGEPATAAIRPVADDYDGAAAELAAALEARRSELDPATVRIVEENLRIVDQAIREAREALAADPANPVLRELVVAGYEQKLDLLRRATRPAAEL